MALVELAERNLLKFIISQNVDGLHRKSGIPPEKITELHGNTNIEICTKCHREFLRDTRVRNS
jgi:NAD-dependent SIR2 family protein deacetylase